MHKDNPSEIAEHLAREKGLEGAIQVSSDGIAEAHQNRDYYSLSVWREVRQKLMMMENKAEMAGGNDVR